MSYRLIRIVTCDMSGCESATPVQGDDDSLAKSGWRELRIVNQRPMHVCPVCAKADRPDWFPEEIWNAK